MHYCAKCRLLATWHLLDWLIDQEVDFLTSQEIASFQGFNSPWWKTLLYYLVGVLTAGVSFLVCKWSPRVHILLSLSPCALRDAQYVRIRVSAMGQGKGACVGCSEVQTRNSLHTAQRPCGAGGSTAACSIRFSLPCNIPLLLTASSFPTRLHAARRWSC